MTQTHTPSDGQATALAPHTGGVPLLALVLSGKLALREHRPQAAPSR